jgi:arylsulfatase
MKHAGKRGVAVLVLSLLIGAVLYLAYGGQRHPNILFVTFDSLTADRLGCYGYEKKPSPNIDAVASDAYIVSDCVSQCGSTLCSLPSLHRSRFPQLDDVFTYPSMAELLKGAGYATFAVSSHDFADNEYVQDSHFDVYDDTYDKPGQKEQTVDRVFRILNQRERKQPFFMWVHFREPHRPYTPRRETFDAFYRGPDDEPLINSFQGEEFDRLDEARAFYVEQRGEEPKGYNRGGADIQLTDSLLRQISALYDANLHEVDREFGRILTYLGREGIYEDTIVVIGSDHGEVLGENGFIGHNHLFYKALHVPLIIRVPGHQGGIVSAPAMNVDILPTLLDLIGLRTDHQFRGTSLLAQHPDRFQFAAYKDFFTLRQGSHKLTLQGDSRFAWLSDLEEDPYELENLYQLEPAIASGLQQRLQELTAGSRDFEDDTLERLRSLGYIQ